ncbi:MAG: hypothetical protein IJR14_01560, partial [Synergistaceae bacterium]|nr:hypothetical protein [Synergistaceae bacterium]
LATGSSRFGPLVTIECIERIGDEMRIRADGVECPYLIRISEWRGVETMWLLGIGEVYASRDFEEETA